MEPTSRQRQRIRVDQKAFWVALEKLEGLGPGTVLRLVSFCGSAQAVWEAPAATLRQIPRMQGEQLEAIINGRQGLDPAVLWQQIEELGLTVITIDEEAYPVSLRRISFPPPVLYISGNPTYLQQKAMAIVGTRKATSYGRHMAEKIAGELARAGWGIVSGLARGIDTAAHRGALQDGGWTIAVLGSGPDIIYPPENAELAASIAGHGAVISEFPPGTRPLRGHFPRRNRLISGLTLGTLVVEAGEKSGALITADLALEQGKDVFAVPGPVTSQASKGTNNLIKQGAKLVEDANDILEEYHASQAIFSFSEERSGPRLALSDREAEVLELLAGGPVQLDVIIHQTGYAPEELLSLLTFLEVQGLVAQLPGSYYLATAGE